MSTEITEAFVTQWGDDVQHLAQQKTARLREAVTVKSGIKGKNWSENQIGQVEAQVRSSRHADTPLMSTPHHVRWGTLVPYEWADLIDEPDKVRMLIDPTNGYTQAAGMALGRAIDRVILDAMTAPVRTGVGMDKTVTLPAGQTIAKGTGKEMPLTVVKLRKAAAKFRGAEVYGDQNEWYIALSAKQLDDLLANTEVTSADYNSVRALVKGELDTFMGFKFIHSQLLPYDSANNTRVAMAWTKSGMCLGIGKDIEKKIDQRPDKSYSWQVFASMMLGAVRMEETKVIKIESEE